MLPNNMPTFVISQPTRFTASPRSQPTTLTQEIVEVEVEKLSNELSNVDIQLTLHQKEILRQR